ncbi:PAAR domain-containing protein [uncultured Dialister sp.]|uniref:PAAR domain-containing protein n=1 Tax=uncultured Dialister sp. TaxID=278064 RepID=UPI0026DB08DC|nr:PAAR domain-containing protein [uncultured Dialister sp.]
MSNATRLGDKDTGHDSCAPTALVSGSPNVFINGKPAGRVGDTYAPHGCNVHPSHSGHVSSGSGSVFINGKPAARVGDPVSCGGTVAEGSGNVFIGG